MHSKTVDLARPRSRYERVPIMVGAVLRGIDADDARRPFVILAFEEQQLYAGSGARGDAEIDSPCNNGGAQRMAPAGAIIGLQPCRCLAFPGGGLCPAREFCPC